MKGFLNEDDIIWHREIIKCVDCGKEEKTDKLYTSIQINSIVCPKCQEKKRVKKFRDQVISEIPPIYRHCEPASDDKLKTSLLWGDYGTGKTHAIWSLVKAYKKKDYLVTTEYRMAMDLKQGYSDNSHDARVKRYKEVGFLAIDEFGKVKKTDNHEAMIFDILNHRYEYQLLTIIAVNSESVESLHNIISGDILDRYRSNIVAFTGESKR